MSPSRICALVATIIFVVAALGVAVGGVALVPLGLAFLALAHVL